MLIELSKEQLDTIEWCIAETIDNIEETERELVIKSKEKPVVEELQAYIQEKLRELNTQNIPKK